MTKAIEYHEACELLDEVSRRYKEAATDYQWTLNKLMGITEGSLPDMILKYIAEMKLEVIETGLITSLMHCSSPNAAVSMKRLAEKGFLVKLGHGRWKVL